MENSIILQTQKLIKQNPNFFKKYYQATFKNLKQHKDLNAILTTIKNYDQAINNPNSNLNQILYAVKDNINVKNYITTGGSLFFENYKSVYNATVINLLNNAGAIPVCKTNLDEFGLGGTGLFSAYGDVLNPFDKNRISGGSSSGSAVLVALKLVAFALGTDTGDSIRMPASYLGIYGYKPTYGLISRNGVFPYSPSIDHVGLFTNSVSDIAIIMDKICQYDEFDYTSQDIKLDFVNTFKQIDKNIKITYLANLIPLLEQQPKALFENTIKLIKKSFNISKSVYPLDLIKLIPTVYEILSYSEAVSCYQNITGITFGKKGNGKTFIEKIIDTRTKNFGKELKRRFVLGSYVTLEENANLLLKCKKIRGLIVSEMEKILANNDFVLMPGASNIAPRVKDVKNHKVKPNDIDNYLQIANFAGYPSLTIPMGKINNMHIGINIMGKINSDNKLLAFANMIDKIIKGAKNE